MYQFSFIPYEFDMSHQEGTTKNTVLHKTAKMELSVFAPLNLKYNTRKERKLITSLNNLETTFVCLIMAIIAIYVEFMNF